MAQNGSIMKFIPEVLWRDIQYKIDGKDGESKRILNGISGSFKFGEMTAVMGPSGSGKTTLLECIIKKREKGFSGDIEFRCTSDPIVAIIPQHSYFLPEFTVREVLWYASHLKNESSDHEKIIDDVIKKLGLKSCEDNRVTKCSGGELKRLAIAQELVSPTNILILDEPTSGLDSTACYEVMKVLEELVQSSKADNPIAVVASIHQPSTRVFNLFDKIYAISSNGECVYEESPLNVHKILSKVKLELPNNYNPADYLIEVCYGDQGLDKIQKLVSKHKSKYRINNSNSPKVQEMPSNITPNISQILDESETSDETIPLLKKGEDKTSDETSDETIPLLKKGEDKASDKKSVSNDCKKNFRHIGLLFMRALKAIVFNWIAISLQIGTYTTSPVMISVLYNYKIGNASGCPQAMSLMSSDEEKLEMKGINDNLAFIFFALLLFMMGGIMMAVLTFPLEMSVLSTETGNKWYKCWTYFIGRSLADSPFQISFPVVFCAIAYVMTGQIPEFWRFCLFSLLMVFVSFCAQSQGLIMGALFMDNVAAAVFISVTTTVPIMLFGGYFIRIANMPKWISWLSYISYFRYTYQAMLISLYGFNRCNCDQSLRSDILCQSSVMSDFELTDYHLWESMVGIFVYFIVVRYVTYLIVKFKISKKT